MKKFQVELSYSVTWYDHIYAENVSKAFEKAQEKWDGGKYEGQETTKPEFEVVNLIEVTDPEPT